MVKKVITVLIILAVSIGIFYLGWVQISLPIDHYGVIYTKTGGWNNNIIAPGKFIWKWEKILPTNLKMFTYDLTPKKMNIDLKGELPSNAVYSKFIEGSPDFSYELDLFFHFRLNPEKLADLVKDNGLRPENLEGFYSDMVVTCKGELSAFVLNESGTFSVTKDLDTFYKNLEVDISEFLKTRYKWIDIIQISPRIIKIPDFSLYQKAKEEYFKILEVRRETTQDALLRSVDERSEETIKIELLREYGKLFNEYPILIDFFAATNGNTKLNPKIKLPVE